MLCSAVAMLTDSAVTAASDEVDQVKLLEAVKRYRPHSVRLFSPGMFSVT